MNMLLIITDKKYNTQSKQDIDYENKAMDLDYVLG